MNLSPSDLRLISALRMMPSDLHDDVLVRLERAGALPMSAARIEHLRRYVTATTPPGPPPGMKKPAWR